MKRTERTRLFYKTLPLRARVILDVAVFCLFAPIGLATAIMSPVDRGWPGLAALIIMCGGAAVLYARAGFTGRNAHYVGAGLAVQGLFIWALRQLPAERIGAAPQDFRLEAGLLISFIGVGYALFLSVFTREGARYWATSAEIKIAQRIHQRLVPAISGSNRDAEWAGVSTPSGDIGGDMVDVVEGPAGLVGCVADVSGHGVGAGLLMGMFKTAFRSSVTRLSDPAELLAEIHVALSPLTEPNMFATAGMLRVTRGTLQYAGGGHPPLLLYRRASGRVDEVASTGPAIALLEDFSCASLELPFLAGDVALLVTDGIFEAIDSDEREVGLDAVKQLLAQHAGAPLPDLLARIAALQPSGARQDDQTVLIVRARITR